jgi:hypothetical protein
MSIIYNKAIYTQCNPEVQVAQCKEELGVPLTMDCVIELLRLGSHKSVLVPSRCEKLLPPPPTQSKNHTWARSNKRDKPPDDDTGPASIHHTSTLHISKQIQQPQHTRAHEEDPIKLHEQSDKLVVGLSRSDVWDKERRGREGRIVERVPPCCG